MRLSVVLVALCVLAIAAPADAHVGINGGTDSTNCPDDNDVHVHINTSHTVTDMVCTSVPPPTLGAPHS